MRRPGLDGRPDDLTLTNWDLGGVPSAWAYLHAGELFPAADPSGDVPGYALAAFARTPAEDGSVNRLRWFSRSRALSLGA